MKLDHIRKAMKVVEDETKMSLGIKLIPWQGFDKLLEDCPRRSPQFWIMVGMQIQRERQRRKESGGW